MNRVALVPAAALLMVCCMAPTSAIADDPHSTTSASSTPPVRVDSRAPGLKLLPGATLAAPKVLDIKSVVEDSNGDERRSDTPADVTFSLQAEVLFSMDSADLGPDAHTRIQTIADEIARQNAKTVYVFGFTDNLGSHQHGVDLSKARAQAVYTALAEGLGNSSVAIRFEVRGYAEEYPIADNSTEDGRRKNRRVEISFAKSTSD